MTYTELIEAVQGDLARMELGYLHAKTPESYHDKVKHVVLMVLGLAMKYGDVIPTPPTDSARESRKLDTGEEE